MRTWDFYLPDEEVMATAWGKQLTGNPLNGAMLEELARRPQTGGSDPEMVVALARLAHDEYEAHGTGGTALPNEDSRLLLRTLRAVLTRLGIDSLRDPPMRLTLLASSETRRGAGRKGSD